MKKLRLIIPIAMLLMILLVLSQIFLQNGLVIRRMIQKRRADYENYQTQLAQNNRMPDGVKEYYEDNFNVYVPERTKTDFLPVAINIHGGGLVMGNRDFNRYFNANFAKTGFVVFGIGYPLIPEADVYEQLQSVADTINKVAKVAENYGGDGSRVFLTGDSAGAYLALYTAALAQSEEKQKAFGVTPTTVSIEKLGLLSGMFYTARNDTVGIFLRNQIYGNFSALKPVAKFRNPEYLAETVDLPPMYLQTSTGDYLSSYTADFTKALRKYGRTVEMRNFENNDLVHAFAVFYPEREETKQIYTALHDFFTA